MSLGGTKLVLYKRIRSSRKLKWGIPTSAVDAKDGGQEP